MCQDEKKWKKKCKQSKCAGCAECATMWEVKIDDVEEDALKRGRQAWKEEEDLHDEDDDDLDEEEEEDASEDGVPLSDKALHALHKAGWVCHSKCRKTKCKSSANGEPSTANHDKDENCNTWVNLKKCKKKACVGCPGCAEGPGPNVGFGSM